MSTTAPCESVTAPAMFGWMTSLLCGSPLNVPMMVNVTGPKFDAPLPVKVSVAAVRSMLEMAVDTTLRPMPGLWYSNVPDGAPPSRSLTSNLNVALAAMSVKKLPSP